VGPGSRWLGVQRDSLTTLYRRLRLASQNAHRGTDGHRRPFGTGEVTKEEVEEVLDDHEGEVELSEESGNPIVFGWTSTGKHIAVIFVFEDDPDLVIVRPKTAYPVPEYGD
jgi:hypothetical protein